MNSKAEAARRHRAEAYNELKKARDAALADYERKKAAAQDAEARRAAALAEWKAAHAFPESEAVFPLARGGVVERRVENESGGVKADGEKPDLSLLPPAALEMTAAVLTYGARKYSPNNWKKVERNRYIAALLRHVCREMRDPGGADDETGLPHVAHIAANAAILCGLYEEAKKGAPK